MSTKLDFFGAPQHCGFSTRTIGSWVRLAGAAATGVLMSAALWGAPAGASGSSIGSFKLTGEVVASVKTSHEFNHTSILGGTSVSTPEYGCQIGQSGTNNDIINIPDGKVVLNGHSTKATGMQFSVPTDGKTDTLTSSSDQLSFTLAVGKLSYIWVSSTGTITTAASGKSGNFSVTLVPDTNTTGADSSSATKSLHVSGSWTSCNPWP
jgi:hypothetical protein